MSFYDPMYIGSGFTLMRISSGADNNQPPVTLALVVGSNRDDCKRKWLESRGPVIDLEAEFDAAISNWKSVSWYE